MIGDAALRKVERHDRVFRKGAALHEQDLELGRHGEQLTQAGFGARKDFAELAAAVAHLHHAHA